MAGRVNPLKKRHGAALTEAIGLSRLRNYEIASKCEVVPRTLARWMAGETWPTQFQQQVLVHTLHETGRVPRALLVELAAAAAETLESLGLEAPPPAPPRAPPVRADAQKIVDDAIREAAETLDVAPRIARPIAARLFEAIANAAIPAEAAARLALGAPKKGS